MFTIYNLMQSYQNFFMMQKRVKIEQETVVTHFPAHKEERRRVISCINEEGCRVDILYKSNDPRTGDYITIDTILVYDENRPIKMKYSYLEFESDYLYEFAEHCLIDNTCESINITNVYTESGKRIQTNKPLSILSVEAELFFKTKGSWSREKTKEEINTKTEAERIAKEEAEAKLSRKNYQKRKYDIVFVKHTYPKKEMEYDNTLAHLDIKDEDFSNKDNTGTPMQSFMGDVMDAYNEYVGNYDYE